MRLQINFQNAIRTVVILIMTCFLINFSVVSTARADKLTLTAQLSAKDLHPDVDSVLLSCRLLLTENFKPETWQPYEPYPTISKTSLPRKADGTANGSLSVVFDTWIPEAKYYYCSLTIQVPGGTTGFYLPGDKWYSEQPMYRRALSGNLSITGSIQ